MKTLVTLGALLLTVPALAGEQHAQSAADHEMKMMDADKDGKVSPTEHAAGAKQMFTKMDGNQDGKVTAAEMDAAQKTMKGKHAGKQALTSAEKTRVIDTDQDGTLSSDEHVAGSRAMFNRMDTDKDDTLTVAEIQAGHDSLMGGKKIRSASGEQ